MLRTLCHTNFILYEHLNTNSCLWTIRNTNFFLYELLPTNRLYTNFIRYKLLEYEPYPLWTFAIMNFLPYEHYPIWTSADEHLLTNIFPYGPCVYELSSGYRGDLPTTHTALKECWHYHSQTKPQQHHVQRFNNKPYNSRKFYLMTIYCIDVFNQNKHNLIKTMDNNPWFLSMTKPNLI